MIEISHEETPNQLMVYCFEVMIEIKSFFFVFKWLLFFRLQRFGIIFLISKYLIKIISTVP